MTLRAAGGGSAIGGSISGGMLNSVLFINPAGAIAQDNPNFTYNQSTTTFSAPIIVGAQGSGAATTFRFSNLAANSGFYSPAAAMISVGIGNVEQMRWTANGVGIFNGKATAAMGLAPVVFAPRSTAQTAAVAQVGGSAYITSAADGSFRVSANVLVTASTTHNFTVTVAYTDEGNTARTLTLNFSSIGGVLATQIINTGGTTPYEGVPLHIRCKASTAITFATTGTFTSVNYNVEGSIEQLS